MKVRFVWLLLVVALTASACGAASEQSVPLLAIIDSTGNIAIVDGDTGERTRVTTDAGAGRSYFQPVWSPDEDHIVYSENEGGDHALVIVDSTGEFQDRIETSVASFFHQWDPTGERIAFLGNGPGGLEFHVADVDAGTSERLGVGSPFYFDWSPEGDRIVSQVARTELAIRDLDGGVEALDDIPGLMQAPQWTDHGVWYISDNELILDGDDGPEAIAFVDGFTTFSVAGERVAIQGTAGERDSTSVAFQQGPLGLTPGLHVIDLETRTEVLVNPDPVLGFWWSPDGSRLAYLTLDDLDSVESSWHVWDGSGITVEFPGGIPSLQFFRDLAPFFDQYTRSMSVWAPDGSALVHPMAVEGVSGIWKLPVDGGDPERVTDGVWATWNR